MATDPSGPWAFADPRSDYTAIPFTDTDTQSLIDQAVDSLVIYRCPVGLGDAGAKVSTLVSLVAEADGHLADAVADARDQGYSWDTELLTEVAAADGHLGDGPGGTQERDIGANAASSRTCCHLCCRILGFIQTSAAVTPVGLNILKRLRLTATG